MTIRLLSLILASVALSALAQLFLKFGVNNKAPAQIDAPAQMISGTFGLLASPWVWAGLALYGLGTLIWLGVLARAPLSFAYPFVGLGFIFTALLGLVVLHEPISLLRGAGIVFIVLGCTLVARSA